MIARRIRRTRASQHSEGVAAIDRSWLVKQHASHPPVTLADFPSARSFTEDEPYIAAPDWVCAPVSISSVSPHWEAKQWDEFEARVSTYDPDFVDTEILLFFRPAPGVEWIQLIFARPGSPAAGLFASMWV